MSSPVAPARRSAAPVEAASVVTTFPDDEEMTMLLPSSLRGEAVGHSGRLPQPKASRPLLSLNTPDEDDGEATRLFDTGRLSARPSAHASPSAHSGQAPPGFDQPTMLAAGQKKNTLARHPSDVEDDIQARARLAFETGENAARGRGFQPPHPQQQMQPPQQAPQMHGAHPGHSGSTPAPAFVDPHTPAMVGASRRPARSATSTASAFQRTEAEIPPAFAPSARPIPKTNVGPLPGAPSSLPAASWTASGEQVAHRPAARRGAASWFMALGVAAAVVAVGSAVLVRNPSTALAASALADPQLPTAAAPTAELPTELAAPPAATSALVAATPPPAPAPQYVPGMVPAAEPVAEVAPPETQADDTKHAAAEPPAKAKKAEAAHAPVAAHTPTPAKAPAAPKPTKIDPPAKADPPPKKVVVAADPPPKKPKKGEQSDEERKASEEAARLARKQLDDQL